MQKVETERDSRKANFGRSYNVFADSPSGFDVTPLHSEYTYKNDEGIQRVFKDGKNRSFFYIKDKLWKIYDEIPLKADGPLGDSYQAAVAKLNALLGAPGRVRAADPSEGLERTTTDWQDAMSHLRADDRSGEHLVGIVLEDKRTLANLASLRAHKARGSVRHRSLDCRRHQGRHQRSERLQVVQAEPATPAPLQGPQR